MTKRRLAIITAAFPYTYTESFLTDEIRELNKNFSLEIFPLKVICNPKLRTNQKFFEISHKPSKLNGIGNAVKNPKKLSSVLLFLIRKTRGRPLLRNLSYLPVLFEIYSILRMNPVGHIHAYWGSSPAFVAMFLCDWLKIEYSFTLHRYDIFENDFLADKYLKAKFCRSISKWGKDALFTILGKEYTKNTKVIHLGINIPRLKLFSAEKTLKIACVGAYIKRKNHYNLIKALVLVRKVKKIKAFFYGQGPLKNKMMRQISKSHLEKDVFLGDFLPHDKLISKLKRGAFNLVVLPSKCEGIPVSLIEAAANSTLIIGSDRGGTSELIRPDTGLLITDPNSPEEIAHKIISIDAESASRLIRQNYVNVKKNFNVKICVAKLTKAIIKR